MANNVVSMDKKSKKENTSVAVEGFMKRNRVAIIVTVCVLIVAGITVGLICGIKDSSVKKALAAIDEIEYTYTKDSNDLSDGEISARQSLAMELLSSYTGKSGVAGVRANMLAGSISFESGNFADSASYYEKAASIQKKAYTAPICMFSAAAAYEELGDNTKAEELYLKSTENFDLASHAYFNVGRLRESRGDYAGAVEAYGMIASGDDWENPAKSRILMLKAEGKAE